MSEPTASRPYMPGYGILDADSGGGLLAWADAERALAASRNYWVTTAGPDGTPHLMPVWAVWLDGEVWFSSSLRSRKIRNLAANPRCTVSTEDADNPVIVSGTATVTTDLTEIARFLAASNKKYDVDYRIDFLDPAVNATVRLAPSWAFSLRQGDFAGSPTRWVF
jgi:PPOX class probable F420-dependent enzyme